MLTMHAGPWIGEFGWELFGWQGFLRAMSSGYDSVRIYGPTGHRYLYEDFCTEYHEVDLAGPNPSMWKNDPVNFDLISFEKGDVWIQPQQLTLMRNAPPQRFVHYGDRRETKGKGVAIHARSITKYGSDYINMPAEKWDPIIDALSGYQVYSIGTKDGAYHIPGTSDFRDMPLRQLCTVLRSSHAIIGPSSGPMHLAALCDCPIIVWSGYARSGPRYMTDWNPFNVKVKTIIPFGDPWGNRKPWQPSTDDVIKAIRELECAH